jgi:hypothetical protein
MVISAITVADEAFSVLVCRPAPLAFDARGLSDLGLPQRLIALDELRDLLVERVVRGPAVDEVWRHLTLAARSWGPEWVVGAVGLAVPGLRAIAARLAAGRSRLAEDIDAEVVAGFLAALRTADLDRPRLWLRLMWVAWRAGHQAAQVWETSELPADLPSGSSTPRAPYGHPDLLLGRAVATGVLSAEEAELIGHQRVRDVEVAAADDAEHLLDTEPGQGGPHGSAMFIPALPAVQRSTRASTRHGLALPDRQR